MIAAALLAGCHHFCMRFAKFDPNLQTQTKARPTQGDLGVSNPGDTAIVSVLVRFVKVRFFGFSSRQRTTRTRGEVTRYRKMDFAWIRSGSGESWFDPRRGNYARLRGLY